MSYSQEETPSKGVNILTHSRELKVSEKETCPECQAKYSFLIIRNNKLIRHYLCEHENDTEVDYDKLLEDLQKLNLLKRVEGSL